MEKNQFIFLSPRWFFSSNRLRGGNNVIYVENTYLHSHISPCSLHTNSIHIYAHIIIYGLEAQWFPSSTSTSPVKLLTFFFSPFAFSTWMLHCVQTKFTFWFDGQSWGGTEDVQHYLFRSDRKPLTADQKKIAREKGEKRKIVWK